MQQQDPVAIEQTLREIPIFATMSEESLHELVNRCRTVTYEAGQTIVAPDTLADRFFVILQGRVKISQLSAEGAEQILHLYDAGCSFGEAAMWQGRTFPAFAEALSPLTLLVVDRVSLLTAISEHPEVALEMLAGMSSKLREFTRIIENISLKDVPSRLAGTLLGLAADAGSESFELPMSKRHLASQLGTVPETLSRAFAGLRADGLVEVAGARVAILDREGLAARAEGFPAG